MPVRDKRVEEILRKHGARIENQIQTSQVEDINYTREYVTFKDEMAPELTRYERWARSLGNIIKLKLSDKDDFRIRKQLGIAHLDIEPWQALTLAVMSFLAIFFIGAFVSVALFLIVGTIEGYLVLFFVLTLFLSIFVFYFIGNYPSRLGNKWRLKASSQMVPAVLYVVVYMRHTSNLERAIAFAAENLQPPLSLDFKKVFYDVEIGRFSTIKESLDHYLETWRDYSTEFIESFHLIESSLYEPDNNRRIASLEKSLQIILDGVFDKMLKYTHEVKSPLTNVYMLGVVLPTLGLALLPLASAMLAGVIQWYHVFILFNLIVPFFVFYLTDKVMLSRPGGHGETSLLERNPLYYKYSSKKPYFTAFLIVLPFLFIGFLPLIFQYTPLPELINLQKDYSFLELGLGFFGNAKLFDFDAETGKGPFGVGALILSFFIPLAVAMFFSILYKMRTRELIVERANTKQLEREFANSLFQLGNRFENGVPPELVFAKVAESSRGLKTEDFFRRVNYNIHQGGMSVERAIFDKKRGAINYFPSDLIATSMKILVESVKKGLKVAAISLMSISEYIKNIGKITLRLKDMLAEVVSDMKSNMTFLAPLLSGVVVGLAAMITVILSKLDLTGAVGAEAAGFSGVAGILSSLFEYTQMIPPYYLQIAVGIYIIQVIFILTNTLVTVDSGEDKLQRKYLTGKNLSRGVLLYVIVAFVSVLALFILASIVLAGFG